MTAQVLQFVELSDADRKETGRLGKLAKGDQIEVHIKRSGGGDQTLSLPPEAASLIENAPRSFVPGRTHRGPGRGSGIEPE